MRCSLKLRLLWPLLAAQAFGGHLSLALLDMQYAGEKTAGAWYGPALTEALRYYLSAQDETSVLPPRKTRIHRDNHKKGNKPEDLFRFGALLRLDGLVSGEYTVERDTLSATVQYWDIKREAVRTGKFSGSVRDFYKLTAAMARSFSDSSKGPSFKDPGPPAAPPEVFGIYAKAVELYAGENVPDGLYAARRAIVLAPDFAPAYHLTARLYLFADQAAQGLAPAERASAIDPLSGEYAATYADALLKNGKGVQALKYLKEKRSQCRDPGRLEGALGRVYLSDGFPTVAVSCFVKAVNDQPGSTEETFLLGKAFLGAEEYDKAVQSLERAVELEPNNTLYQSTLGIACREGGNLTRAIRLLESLADRRPDFLPAIFHLSSAYNVLGWHKKSLQVLTRAQKKNPRSPEILAGLAITKMKMGLIPEAEKIFELALSLNPNSATVLNNFGVLMLEKKENGKAADLFEKALKVEKRSPGIAYNLGAAYFRLGKLDAAEKNIQLAIDASPKNIDARRLLSEILEGRNRPEEALFTLSEIVVLDPGDDASKVKYGLLLLKSGEKERGVSILEDVVKTHPGNVDYLLLLIDAYKTAGWYDIAVLKLEKMLQENRQNTMILTWLGEFYYLKAALKKEQYENLMLKSLHFLKESYRLSAEAPETLFWYGRVLLEFKKDTETAAGLLRKSLLFPLPPEEKKEAERLLKNLRS